MSSRVRQFATAFQAAVPRTERLPGPKARVYQFPVRQEPVMRPGNGTGALRGAIYALLAEGLAALAIYGIWHLVHVMH